MLLAGASFLALRGGPAKAQTTLRLAPGAALQAGQKIYVAGSFN